MRSSISHLLRFPTNYNDRLTGAPFPRKIEHGPGTTAKFLYDNPILPFHGEELALKTDSSEENKARVRVSIRRKGATASNILFHHQRGRSRPSKKV
jgi:hypothetical protein